MFNIKIGSEGGESFYHTNKVAMQHAGVIMDVTDIQIGIPSDVNIDVTQVGATRAEHVEKFAKTVYQLEQLFKRYCIVSCGVYQKDGSWERIKYHTELLFEEYLAMFGAEVYKIVLYNQERFNDLYNLAKELYGKMMAAKASSKTTTVKEYEQPWDVPEFKIFNDKYVEYKTETHALDPLYARNRGANQLFDSGNEHRFIDLLIQNEGQHIQWWYKNGSCSKEDFAIPYTKRDGTQSLFYVDVVIKFKSNILALFDPKTIESDPENVVKHNALIDYVDNLNAQGKKVVGSIMIPHQGSWRYCKNRIENDKDLTGWDFFNPADINKN